MTLYLHMDRFFDTISSVFMWVQLTFSAKKCQLWMNNKRTKKKTAIKIDYFPSHSFNNLKVDDARALMQKNDLHIYYAVH